MYPILSEISRIISTPLFTFLHSYTHAPIVVAILLGIIGAFAPCQITGNLSALTLYGSRTIQFKDNWVETIYFIFGKIVIFSVIGFFAWMFGQTFETELTKYFPILRKIMGPIMIVTGLVLLGVFRMRWLNKLTVHIPVLLKEGRLNAFLLGISFGAAFCPTMFVLFFVWLMPTVAATSYGLVLPGIFGIATSTPLVILLIFSMFMDSNRRVVKKSKQIGAVVQNVAGVVLVLLGILDTITYW